MLFSDQTRGNRFGALTRVCIPRIARGVDYIG